MLKSVKHFIALFLLLPVGASAATWYLDVGVTGTSLNNGTNWANAWTNVQYASYTNSPVQPDDVIEVSGGTYPGYTWTRGGSSDTPNAWGPPSGTAGHPVTIKKSQTAPHNGSASFPLQLKLDPNTTIDGRLFSTNYSNPFLVDLVTNNCGFFFDNTTRTNDRNVFLIGNPSGVTIKGCLFKGAVYTHSGVKADGIYGNASSPTGLEVAECWFTNFCDSWCIYFNQNSDSPAFGQWSVHHNVFERAGVATNGIGYNFEAISAGTGLDFYWNIVGRYQSTLASEDDNFQIGDWFRMYGNVIYPGGNSMMQSEAVGASYSHIYIYRNIMPPAPSRSGFTVPTGGTFQFNSIPDLLIATSTISDFRFFNNTIVSLTTNKPTGLCSFNNVSWATHAEPWFHVAADGLLVYNNLIYCTNSSDGIVGLAYWAGGTMGPDGYSYDNTEVKVDYNVISGVNYNTNTVNFHGFNTSDFNTYSGFTHNKNYAPQPTLESTSAGDYRPAANDTVAKGQGIDLSAYATNMPGLTVDPYGVTAGASGAWSIGALEPSGMVLWLTFTNNDGTDWRTNGVMLDASGSGNNGIEFGTTNWPGLTNGPLAGMFAGSWSNMWPNPGSQGLNLGDYIVVTNTGIFQVMTQGTAAVWAYANSNSYGGTVLISAGPGTSQVGQSNVWAIARDSNENFRFIVGSNPKQTVIRFPDDTIGHGSGPNAFTMTNWAHYSVTWDCAAATCIGYYDGAPIATNTLGGVPFLMANTNMSNCSGPTCFPWVGIGCNTHDGSADPYDADGYPNNGFFAGSMADVRIYNRALSAAEITSIYSGTPAQGESNPPASTPTVTAGTVNVGTLIIGQ